MIERSTKDNNEEPHTRRTISSFNMHAPELTTRCATSGKSQMRVSIKRGEEKAMRKYFNLAALLFALLLGGRRRGAIPSLGRAR